MAAASEAAGLQAGHRLRPECAQCLCGPRSLGIKDLPDFLMETTMMTSGCDTWAPLALLMTLGSVGRWRDDCSNSGGQPCPRPPARRPEAWNAPASLEAEGQVNNGTVECVPGRGPSF